MSSGSDVIFDVMVTYSSLLLGTSERKHFLDFFKKRKTYTEYYLLTFRTASVVLYRSIDRSVPFGAGKVASMHRLRTYGATRTEAKGPAGQGAIM